jgi:hypothetical protein
MLSFYIESTVAVYDVDPNCRNQAITPTTNVELLPKALSCWVVSVMAMYANNPSDDTATLWLSLTCLSFRHSMLANDRFGGETQLSATMDIFGDDNSERIVTGIGVKLRSFRVENING